VDLTWREIGLCWWHLALSYFGLYRLAEEDICFLVYLWQWSRRTHVPLIRDVHVEQHSNTEKMDVAVLLDPLVVRQHAINTDRLSGALIAYLDQYCAPHVWCDVRCFFYTTPNTGTGVYR
jgi:hypothetical protein